MGLRNNITLNIRPAKKADKEEVLRFCTDTFDWGDYIEQVWDSWRLDQKGVLLVAEEAEYGHNQKQSPVIAVSHASLCPKKNVWLEGIRVNPNFRRRSVATQLLNKMISYGKKQGAREASAMVADNNIASQLMILMIKEIDAEIS